MKQKQYPMIPLVIFSCCLLQVRSILLRGFDQQLAEMIGDHMKGHGMKFIRPCVPTKIEMVSDGKPGLYKVGYIITCLHVLQSNDIGCSMKITLTHTLIGSLTVVITHCIERH